mmetsp:Transcript_29376/g.94069  ORF Transcript_29376/g.94069 Transcript_29376/m.94069 type:complete len:213 (-) Transcript_29376:393-1031(-)
MLSCCKEVDTHAAGNVLLSWLLSTCKTFIRGNAAHSSGSLPVMPLCDSSSSSSFGARLDHSAGIESVNFAVSPWVPGRWRRFSVVTAEISFGSVPWSLLPGPRIKSWRRVHVLSHVGRGPVIPVVFKLIIFIFDRADSAAGMPPPMSMSSINNSSNIDIALHWSGSPAAFIFAVLVTLLFPRLSTLRLERTLHSTGNGPVHSLTFSMSPTCK